MPAPTAAWRFLLDPHLGPARNMAVDEALLRLARGPVLRLYRWRPATLSFGAHQPAAEAFDSAGCDAAGVARVRRPTGGRAVLHEEDEWTYAVAAPLAGEGAGPFLGLPLLECYRAIAGGLAAGLRRLGLDVEIARSGPREDAETRRAPCFATSARHEILHRGKKLVGSAQRRLPASFLQHGSIPVSADEARLAAATGRTSPAPGSLGSLAEALGRTPGEDEFAAALRTGFEEALGARLERSALTAEEEGLAALLERDKYATDDWNLRRTEPTLAGAAR